MNINVEDYLYHNIHISPFYNLSVSEYSATNTFSGFSFPFVENLSLLRFDKNVTLRSGYGQSGNRIKEKCIYCGVIFGAYGHFILESLNRYWFIKLIPEEIPLVFTYINSNGKAELHEYQKSIFTELGLEKRKIIYVKDITCFENIYIPPMGYILGNYFSNAQEKALSIRKSNPQNGKKIYLSRSNISAKIRGCVNENLIEDILVSNGWEIIHLEKMSFHEQLDVLASAETILAFSGSALHNIIFLEDIKANIIEIDRAHILTYEVIANKKCKYNNYHVLTLPKKSVREHSIPTESSFLIDIECFKATIEKTKNFSCFSSNIEWLHDVRILDVDRNEYPKYYKKLLNNSEFDLKDVISFEIAYLYYHNEKDLLENYVKNILSYSLVPCYFIPFLTKVCERTREEGDIESLKQIVKKMHNSNPSNVQFNKKNNELIVSNNKDLVKICLHFSNKGWIDSLCNVVCNTSIQQLESIIIKNNDDFEGEIHYTAFQKNGWIKASSKDPKALGITGKRLPLYGLSFSVDKTDIYQLSYRLFFTNGLMSNVFENGQQFLMSQEEIDKGTKISGFVLYLSRLQRV